MATAVRERDFRGSRRAFGGGCVLALVAPLPRSIPTWGAGVTRAVPRVQAHARLLEVGPDEVLYARQRSGLAGTGRAALVHADAAAEPAWAEVFTVAVAAVPDGSVGGACGRGRWHCHGLSFSR